MFKAFEAVPHLIDTRKKTTYFQTTAELDIGTTSSGAYHARVVAIRTNSQKHTELIKGEWSDTSSLVLIPTDTS